MKSKSESQESSIVVGIISAVAGALVGAIITGFFTLFTGQTHISIYFMDPNNREVLRKDITIHKRAESFNLLLNENDMQTLLALAPSTEVAKPPEFSVRDLLRQKITYSDKKEQIDQVKSWLTNEYSGYPSLLRALKKLLKGRCPEGNPVPLTIINGHYQVDTSQPTMVEDLNRLEDAYVAAWREKNSGSSLISFDKIAPPCK
jgi:hypothetical protein